METGETQSATPSTAQGMGARLSEIEQQKKMLALEEISLVEKGLESHNPADILKAMEVVKIQQNAGSDDRKSFFVDPLAFDNSFGYKQPPTSITYELLQAMARTPITNSIIKTRKNQIARFAEPQRNRFSTGFVIRKKGFTDNEDKLSKQDRQRIDEVTEFILNCGETQSWSRDNFETWLRKTTDDSLTFDQDNTEIIRNKNGSVHEFIAVDAMTMRIADSYSDSDYAAQRIKGGNNAQPLEKRTAIAGYYPSYVQTYQSRAIADFYPWEMTFGVRNPTTRIYGNGYGRSELEDMVAIVTSMLHSDQYNSNFFKVGSAPKGILQIKGGMNNPRVKEFIRYWRAMVSGVENAWRTPVIDTESAEWIDMQKNSRDMEFSRWQEYLIKLECALYTIDPSEIGFHLNNGGDGAKPMFEKDNASNIKFSKDKGLKPLLKYREAQLNKYIVSQVAPDLVLEFVGLDGENENEYMTRIKDEVGNIKTLNEVRKEANLKPIEGGDIVLNSMFIQNKSADQQMQMQQDQMAGMDGGEDPNEMDDEGESRFEPKFPEGEEEASPMVKAFNQMVEDIAKGKI